MLRARPGNCVHPSERWGVSRGPAAPPSAGPEQGRGRNPCHSSHRVTRGPQGEKASPVFSAQAPGSCPGEGDSGDGSEQPHIPDSGSPEGWIAQAPPHPLTFGLQLPHLLPGPRPPPVTPWPRPRAGQLLPCSFIKGTTAELPLKMKKVPANPFCETLMDQQPGERCAAVMKLG